MMTHRERLWAAACREMTDILPYAPRIDLWYNANSYLGTLPLKHKGRTQEEIARAEGWAFHKVCPEYSSPKRPEENLHRAIGLFSLKEFVYDITFSSDIEIEVVREGDRTHITYHTPKGTVSTTTLHSEEMRRSGISFHWIDEHIIKSVEDYPAVQYIFETLKVIPKYDDFIEWDRSLGDDGLAICTCSHSGTPMHHIQKDFLDATEFYYHYNDYPKQIRALAEAIDNFYEQALKIVAESPAKIIQWGTNWDDTITPAPYFKKEILPWIRRYAEVLGDRDKVLLVHTDGENAGLMDLIKDTGAQMAEAVCPFPMTKLPLDEYYRQWGDKMSIWGGIPSNMLLAESTSEEEFEAYIDYALKAVAPGKGIILGIADTTPPNAVFDRLVRVGERVEKEGRMPLEGGAFRPITEKQLTKTTERLASKDIKEDKIYKIVQEDIYKGNFKEIQDHVKDLLDKGTSADDILNYGMLTVMDAIGEKFKTGEVFIPEVLLSARALNSALPILEPFLTGDERGVTGKILIGTVQGDMHDIGKNLVVIMLKGVGFHVHDMGINVSLKEILRQVEEVKPHILGLSALLTTTMPEMKKVIDKLTDAGMRDRVKVIVGGAPVSSKFADNIGADGYAPDAGGAVTLVKNLMTTVKSV